MKLLLTNPNFDGVVLVPSLGLGFIGTYVKKHAGCEVEVIEPLLEGLTRVQTLEKAKTADIVGLTCYTESRFQTFDFARDTRKINPNCKIIVGGPHVNSLDEKTLEHYPFIDAVVRGEGEETVLEIVKGVPFKDIDGITWAQNGRIIKNPPRTMKKDIDYLEYDYSLIYRKIKTWKDFEAPKYLQKFNAIPIIGSRGCPFKCSFCAANNQWEHTYRYLSPEELINRVKHLVNEYNIRYFRFYDALFIGNDERMLRFCDLIEENKLDIHFRIDIRVGTKRNILERLKKAGCDVVGFGVESGSNKILQKINKDITREQIEETIRLCKELNYWVIGFFMVSLPNEKTEDVKQTLGLLKYFDGVNVQFFKLHPNTSFYDELKNSGEIDDEIWFSQDRGFNTMYGNEIYYCKEKFKSAQFYKKESEFLIERASCIYALHKPLKILREYGLIKGSRILISSLLKSALLTSGTGKNVYGVLKNLRKKRA